MKFERRRRIETDDLRNLSRMTQDNYMAHVAQLVEHVLGKDEVTRSIRVVGSIPALCRGCKPRVSRCSQGIMFVLAKELRHGEGEI